MSDDQKKIVIIVVAIIAIGVAIFSVTRTVTADQPHNAGPLGGYKGAAGAGKGGLKEGQEQP
jgi:hypothetical protein